MGPRAYVAHCNLPTTTNQQILSPVPRVAPARENNVTFTATTILVQTQIPKRQHIHMGVFLSEAPQQTCIWRSFCFPTKFWVPTPKTDAPPAPAVRRRIGIPGAWPGPSIAGRARAPRARAGAPGRPRAGPDVQAGSGPSGGVGKWGGFTRGTLDCWGLP